MDDEEDILRLFGCGDDGSVWTPSSLYQASEEVLNISNTFLNESSLIEQENGSTTTQQISSPLNLQINSYEHSDEHKETFHPISCVRCRKAHSFCDRRIPKCERCTKSGTECVYLEPKRTRDVKEINESRKKKKQLPPSDSSTTINASDKVKEAPISCANPIIFNSLSRKFTKSRIIENYYLLLCDVYTLVDRTELEQYILKNEQVDNSLMNTTFKEMECFYQSAKGLVEQFVGQGGEASIQKCKQLLSVLLMEREPSFIVSCTYYNLAIYEYGFGRKKLSNYYIYSSRYYFNSKIENSVENSIYERNLWKSSMLFQHLAMEEIGLTGLVNSVPKLFEYSTGQKLDQEILSVFEKPITLENCFDLLKIGEVIGNLLMNSTLVDAKRSNVVHLQAYSRALQFFHSLLLNGMRIGVLIKLGIRRDLIEEAALSITKLTESEFFGVSTVIMIPYFTIASRIHLEIVKSIKLGRMNVNTIQEGREDEPVDYCKVLKMDLIGLEFLNSRFNTISTNYGKLMNEMKHLLEN